MDYRPGCQLLQPNANPLDWSFRDMTTYDAVIACMGTTPVMEGEEGDALLSPQQGDRADIRLPLVQRRYLKKLAAHGAKIVLVLTGGSPIVLGEVADLAQAIVFVWYPGQAGGRAVADVLFGEASPSGKLPLTFPRSMKDLPPFANYEMAGRTYRYMSAEPLYPFGFGLSYTHFAYSELRLSAEHIAVGEPLTLDLTLSNTGATAGDEVVQIYLSDLEASAPVPQHRLVGFQHVSLQPGESRTLSFTLLPAMMALVDENGQERLEPGAFRVTVGGCSPGPRGQALGAPAPLSAVFTVEPSEASPMGEAH
jgi:beta-glucosidase